MCFLAYLPPKRCTKCNHVKDWDAFSTDRRKADGMLSWCKVCNKIKNFASYQRHKEKRATEARRKRETDGEHLRAQARARYAANPEHYRAAKRAELLRNPARVRQRNRDQRKKHHQKILQAGRLSYQKNPQRLVTWRRANLATVRLIASRRRARKKNLPDTFTLTDRQFMLSYWHHACAVCGNQEGLWWTLADDHWIPLSDPQCPGTVPENIVPLCHGTNGCNNSKNDTRNPQAWLESRYGRAKARRIMKTIAAYFAIVLAHKSERTAD